MASDPADGDPRVEISGMKIILGPCPCQNCGTIVYWCRTIMQSPIGIVRPRRWCEKTGAIHSCYGGAK